MLRPELVRLGDHDLIDAPRNNLVARLARRASERVALLQNYTPTQHHNLMAASFSSTVANAAAYGFDEPAVFGQGVGQNTAHQVVMLAVLKRLVELEGQSELEGQTRTTLRLAVISCSWMPCYTHVRISIRTFVCLECVWSASIKDSVSGGVPGTRFILRRRLCAR